MNAISNQNSERKHIIEEHTKTASSSMRKIVIALMITVFGLAFEQETFVFTSWKLKFAVILFVLYFGLDMFQYIYSVWNESKFRTINKKKTFYFFVLKFIPALIGLILILLEVIFR
jgi:hypothetical protein